MTGWAFRKYLVGRSFSSRNGCYYVEIKYYHLENGIPVYWIYHKDKITGPERRRYVKWFSPPERWFLEEIPDYDKFSNGLHGLIWSFSKSKLNYKKPPLVPPEDPFPCFDCNDQRDMCFSINLAFEKMKKYYLECFEKDRANSKILLSLHFPPELVDHILSFFQ
jgi:hypothetical protein